MLQQQSTSYEKFGIQANVEMIHLDVDSDSSIIATEERIRISHGRLDVLFSSTTPAPLIPRAISSLLSTPPMLLPSTPTLPLLPV